MQATRLHMTQAQATRLHRTQAQATRLHGKQAQAWKSMDYRGDWGGTSVRQRSEQKWCATLVGIATLP